MQKYGDALAEIVATLKGAGIHATTELAQAQLPGAIVIPGPMSFDILDGDNYSAFIEIYLLTSNKGSVQSLNDLQTLIEKFRSVYQVVDAEPVSLTLPNIAGNDPVPGLLVNLQATITKE